MNSSAVRPRVLRTSIHALYLPAVLAFAVFVPLGAMAQGFPNIARTPGELIAGPIAPEQGRTAIVAWHGERIVSVPEAPGSQPGADLMMRVVNIEDLDGVGPVVSILPAHASGFHAHGYFKTEEYLFVGPHCLGPALDPCNGTFPHDIYANGLRIGGPDTPIGDSNLQRAEIGEETGLLLGSVQRAGAQSPWGLNDFWTYNDIVGDMWLAVRRNNDWVYDWSNGGVAVGPAVQSSWDHLGLTGVTGFPFIIGNILLVVSDQAGSGVASYDISDLSNPVLLDVLKEGNPGGYWPDIYGHYIFFPRRDGEGGPGSQAGFMVVDFEDPTDLKVVANRNLPGSNQYVTFQDEYAFMNEYKIDMRTFEVELDLELVPGVIDSSQFALPVGNLLVTGGYGTDGPGLAIWAHQADPDTRGPFVAYHVPRPDQINYPQELPITLSIPETLKSETIVDGDSLILQPIGGSPIETWHAFSQGKMLTVTPVQPLAPDTTYELILTSDIEDAAGNGLEPYSFRFSTGNDVAGGNTPPSITSVTLNPDTAAPGELVAIEWNATDTDGGLLEYRIDFGDGTAPTAWSASTNTTHIYTDAGHYQITIQVRDSLGAISAFSRRITVAPTPAAEGSTKSDMIAIDETMQRAYAVNPDNDTVTAIDLTTSTTLWEAPVGDHPKSIAADSNGNLWVVCRDADQIDILDPSNGAAQESISLDYGSRPLGIAPAPNATTMYASLEGTGRFLRFDTATRSETGAIDLGPYPRAIAITADGMRALVTRFISGQDSGTVYDVDLSGAMSLTREIVLARDQSEDGGASGRGVPNYLTGIAIDPNGAYAWVVGKKDNTTRGTFFSPDLVPGQDSTVRAIMMLIDLNTNAENLGRRMDIDNSDSPSSIAFSPLGDYAFITLQGTNQVGIVDVFDFVLQMNPGVLLSRIGTGLAPQSIVMNAAGEQLLTKDLMGRSVTILDADEFITAGNLNIPSTQVATVSNEQLSDSVLNGKRIFYNAGDLRMSAEGYISCATCHLDGGHDGRTWDFTNRGEGFRNTIDLRGRAGLEFGNVHWTANFDEIQDFENDIRGFFGGSGFLSDGQFATTNDPLGERKSGLNNDLDDLAAYVSSLDADSLPRTPFGTPIDAANKGATLGETIFIQENCHTCHNPATGFTDALMHDVGTLSALSGQRRNETITGIKTPTLLGVHDTAPYFHDGRASTLEEVLTITGGTLLQAEEGTLGGGAFAEDIAWYPMVDWHAEYFVNLEAGRTITFDAIETTAPGEGFIEVRYCVSYGNAAMNVEVNGGGAQQINLARTYSNPEYVPNEWRTVRIPITFQSGTNTIVITKAFGGQLWIDDVLFSTPDAAAAASAHVRNLTPEERDALITYLLSLDGAAFANLIGDINGDGNVNAIDIQLCILAVLGTPIDPTYNPDMNADTITNAIDIQTIINLVLAA